MSADESEVESTPVDPPARAPKSLEWAVRVGRQRSSRIFYGFVRGFIRIVLFRWLRTRVSGAEHLQIEGPVIVAPVHRSNLDAPLVAGVAGRRLRALGKESLFVNPLGAWVCAALGAIPIRRGEADREAMRSARALLENDEMLIVFPEGTRQSGNEVAGVFDGMSYLASKTGAAIVPIGIAGTEMALPSGAKSVRRAHTALVVGEPIIVAKGRMSRPAMGELSEAVGHRLQAVFDEANAQISSRLDTHEEGP